MRGRGGETQLYASRPAQRRGVRGRSRGQLGRSRASRDGGTAGKFTKGSFFFIQTDLISEEDMLQDD